MTFINNFEQQGHTVYTIEVTSPCRRRWAVQRRYSEIRDLHLALSDFFDEFELPPLPGRRLFGNLDRAFVQERQFGLESYLNGVLILVAKSQAFHLEKILALFLVLGTLEPDSTQGSQPRGRSSAVSSALAVACRPGRTDTSAPPLAHRRLSEPERVRASSVTPAAFCPAARFASGSTTREPLGLLGAALEAHSCSFSATSMPAPPVFGPVAHASSATSTLATPVIAPPAPAPVRAPVGEEINRRLTRSATPLRSSAPAQGGRRRRWSRQCPQQHCEPSEAISSPRPPTVCEESKEMPDTLQPSIVASALRGEPIGAVAVASVARQCTTVEHDSAQCDPGSGAWDWPLSRQETKARVAIIDRHVMLIDREALVSEIQELRCKEPH